MLSVRKLVPEEVLGLDIGGTRARLLSQKPGAISLEPEAISIFECNEYDSLEAIIEEFIRKSGIKVTHVCAAIAGPVSKGRVKLTKREWPEITEDSDECCKLAFDLYCAILGSIAGEETCNKAGIVLGGGVFPKIVDGMEENFMGSYFARDTTSGRQFAKGNPLVGLLHPAPGAVGAVAIAMDTSSTHRKFDLTKSV